MANSPRINRSIRRLAIFAALLSTARCAADDVIDSPMYHDPNVPNAHAVKTFPKELIRLWIEALGRPEMEYKCQAALAIALAHGQGMKGLNATIPALKRELETPNLDLTVGLAIAKALVALDARDAAAGLLKLTSADAGDLAEIIDPALVKWDYKPARAVWNESLGQTPPMRRTLLAIQSLGKVRDEKSASRLRGLVFSRDVPPAVRLEAARALGAIHTSGAEADASTLASDTSPGGIADRLSAVSLLRQHQGDESVKLLMTFAVDKEPAIASAALTRLIEIDPKLVEPILKRVLANDDANVRRRGVEALSRTPSDSHIALLGERLSDAHPGVRTQARRAMFELSSKHREIVIQTATKALAADDWRGQEQGALLLGQVNHKPAVTRLLELLDSRRGEVCLACAWALRKLDVPETVPGAFVYFKRTVEAGDSDPRKLPAKYADQHLSQLGQFLGLKLHQPAEPVFRRLVTNKKAGGETRTAAVWALGRFHPGDPIPQITRALQGRLNAVGPGDMEPAVLRRMCAITLGLMNAKDALPMLRKYYLDERLSLDIVNNGCGWAIEKITGERVPPGDVVEQMQRNWFLSPID
jgi:HEAT repeat protein